MTETYPADGDNLSVTSVDGLDPEGGVLVLEAGTANEETIAYEETDELTDELIVITRPDPSDHEQGALLEEPDASSSSTSTTSGSDVFPVIEIGPAYDGKDVKWASTGGTLKKVGTYSLGALGSGGSANGAPVTNNLTKIQTHCLQIDSAYTEGYHCLHIYKPSSPDGDSTYDYRIGWWTGSSHAKCCNDLTKVRDMIWFPSDAPSGMAITNWRPTGTTYPGSCSTETTSLTVGHGGVNGTVSSSYEKCAERYGPDGVGATNFHFAWWGNKDKATWVGMGGGAEWRFQPSNGWKIRFNFRQNYCTPDWACH